jgi:hypothetical protein
MWENWNPSEFLRKQGQKQMEPSDGAIQSSFIHLASQTNVDYQLSTYIRTVRVAACRRVLAIIVLVVRTGTYVQAHSQSVFTQLLPVLCRTSTVPVPGTDGSGTNTRGRELDLKALKALKAQLIIPLKPRDFPLTFSFSK